MSEGLLKSKLFRKHYIFWVDDISGAMVAETLLEILGNSNLFYASIARGMYSSLQVLDAIRRKIIQQQFDLAIIDVRLHNSDRYFTKINTISDTMPAPLGEIPSSEVYTDISPKGELERIRHYAGKEGFNFKFEDVKNEAENAGGLFIWAWAFQVCKEAKYIIHSANADVMRKIEFLKIAGVLDTCGKGQLEHIKDVAEYLREPEIYKHYKEYKSAVDNNFTGIRRIKYVLQSNGKTNSPLKDVYEKDFPTTVFGIRGRQDGHPDACVIHNITKNEDGTEWEVTYELYRDLLERAKSGKPYFINKLIEVIHDKLQRRDVDAFNVPILLREKGSWRVEVGKNQYEGIDFALAPISGELNIRERSISLSEEDAQRTYLLSTFFLPWAKDLLSGDAEVVQKSVDDIENEFAHEWKCATRVLKEFCGTGTRFHYLIEGTTDYHTQSKATESLAEFQRLKVDRYLSEETATAIKSYLENCKFHEWRSIKAAVDLDIHNREYGLLMFFEDAFRSGDLSRIKFLKRNIESTEYRCYADVDWIETVLKIALDNLANRAFLNFDGEPEVRLDIELSESPRMMIIRVEDNGTGFIINEDSLLNREGEYSMFKDETQARMLKAYGRLFIESKGKKLELGAMRSTDSKKYGKDDNGTTVTLEIRLP